MKRIENGGPAYPSMNISKASGSNTIHAITKEGMSLRDAFAIAALQGILAGYWSNTAMGDLAPDAIADEAYQHADAMIAVREGGRE